MGKRKREDRDGGSEIERGEKRKREREKERRDTQEGERGSVCVREERHTGGREGKRTRERERERSSTQNATLLAKTHTMPPCSLRSER